jgi:hypothetical protein
MTRRRHWFVAVLEFRKNNPEAKPKEIAEKLKESGVKVTPAYVSTMLSNAERAGNTKGKRGRSAAGNASIDNLLAAKRLVESVGSVAEAREAMAQYSKLMG